jgi:PilZ domain-containing protein
MHGAYERRVSSRIDAPYPIRVRGFDSDNQKFKEDTLLQNLSGGGLYVRLRRKLVVGVPVTVAVRLSTEPAGELPAVRLAARGMVLRVEPQADGTCGTAIEFQQRRVL